MDEQKSTSYQSKDNVYFAAKDADKTASILLDKSRSFFNTLQSNQYLEKLRRMWKFYHGIFQSSYNVEHKIDFVGEQGELINLPVNHFRNIASHIFNMITATRPTMQTRAVNTDYKSLAQTYLADGILDYYMKDKKLEECIKKATEMAIVLGSGYVKLEWDATAGDEYDTDDETGEVVRSGDVKFYNLTPFDVVIDGTRETWENDWVLTRSFKNRFDLIAKYPELENKIKAIPAKSETGIYRLGLFSNDDTDDIAVYEFFHKKTAALPDGRYILFLDSDVVLMDAKMPYRVLPIFRIVPSEILGTPYGYTPMFDIFPLQEAINASYSAIMSNQNAFAVQNIFVQRGADISMESLPGGLNIVEGNTEPKPLNLTETPAEVFKFLEELIKATETISGVNSVTRGNPESSLKSGTALALVQSMSLQFMSSLQQNYVKLIEEVGMSLIEILKDFAMTPKIVALVGKNNRSLLKEFTGESISSINRVIVDMGNPLAKTTAGRVQMAEQMLQMNLITTPQQYFQVINTGRLDSVYEGEMNELLLVKSENENLLEGTPVFASALDQHKLHIMEHKSVIADPNLRKDKRLVDNATEHILEHIRLLRETDPAILAMIGEQPLGPVGGPPQGEQGAPPPGAQQGGPPPQGAPMGPPGGQQGLPMMLVPMQPTQHDQMSPMFAANQGLTVAGEQMSGPGIQNVPLPSPAKVNPTLLPNPELQDQAMGNLQPPTQ